MQSTHVSPHTTPRDDALIKKRLEELAAERRRFGYRRLHVLLLREGIKTNMKRTRRIYKAANLQVRRRLKRKSLLVGKYHTGRYSAQRALIGGLCERYDSGRPTFPRTRHSRRRQAVE